MGFCGENFHGLLARTAKCSPRLQTIVEKTFAINTNNKIRKSFLPRKFPSLQYHHLTTHLHTLTLTATLTLAHRSSGFGEHCVLSIKLTELASSSL